MLYKASTTVTVVTDIVAIHAAKCMREQMINLKRYSRSKEDAKADDELEEILTQQ